MGRLAFSFVALVLSFSAAAQAEKPCLSVTQILNVRVESARSSLTAGACIVRVDPYADIKPSGFCSAQTGFQSDADQELVNKIFAQGIHFRLENGHDCPVRPNQLISGYVKDMGFRVIITNETITDSDTFPNSPAHGY